MPFQVVIVGNIFEAGGPEARAQIMEIFSNHGGVNITGSRGRQPIRAEFDSRARASQAAGEVIDTDKFKRGDLEARLKKIP